MPMNGRSAKIIGDGGGIFTAGHDIQTPFHVSVQTPDQCVELTCHGILRNLPGKRLVCAGTYGDQPVVIKFFLDSRRAKKHSIREERGILALKASNILSPNLLFKGILPFTRTRVLVFQRIHSAVDFADAWDQAATDIRRAGLLGKIISAMANLHQSGLAHNDVHWGNFMVSGTEIYAIDGAAMDLRHRGRPLSEARSIKNLSAFFAQMDPQFDHLLPDAVKIYLKNWSWPESSGLSHRLNRQLRMERRKREKKYLKKIYRESSAYVCQKTWKRFRVCDRSRHTENMQHFLDNPDAFIPADRLLKDGNSSTVARVEVDHRSLVVKRYNMKSFWHALRRCPRPSRAWHSWGSAHRLNLHGISTPRPVAFIENRWGPFRSKAYFITEYAPGVDAYHWFHSGKGDAATERKILEKFGRLMQRFQDGLITHGDLKATNFIFSDGELMVIDLDAMRSHRWAGPIFRRKFRKDCRRLMQNWKDLPEIYKMFRDQIDIIRD